MLMSAVPATPVVPAASSALAHFLIRQNAMPPSSDEVINRRLSDVNCIAVIACGPPDGWQTRPGMSRLVHRKDKFVRSRASGDLQPTRRSVDDPSRDVFLL